MSTLSTAMNSQSQLHTTALRQTKQTITQTEMLPSSHALTKLDALHKRHTIQCTCAMQQWPYNLGVIAHLQTGVRSDSILWMFLFIYGSLFVYNGHVANKPRR